MSDLAILWMMIMAAGVLDLLYGHDWESQLDETDGSGGDRS